MFFRSGWIFVLVAAGAGCSSGDCLRGNCARGELCFEGSCTPAEEVECESDVDCNEEFSAALAYQCVSGFCKITVPVTVVPDSGVREGRDGGSMSFEGRDGGTVSPPDTGPQRDAAEVTDGEAVDAGPRDATPSVDAAPDSGTEDGGLVGPGSFEPGEMFVAGTLQEGAAGRDVICNVLSPNRVSAGFSSSLLSAKIRQTDGALLYISETFSPRTQVLRQFAPDPLLRDEDLRWVYPSSPEANDSAVSTPECPSDVNKFFLHPLTGDAIYGCSGAATLYGPTGPIASCPDSFDNVVDVGADSILCGRSVIDAAGTARPMTSTPSWFVTRPKPGGGFWGVRNNSDLFERWTITATGGVSLDGTYAPVPTGYYAINADVPRWGNIDSGGRFYRWVGNRAAVGTDSIARFESDFSTVSIVYDESTDPICKLHAFNFLR
ncbi:MAG: hypothetical protein HYV07_22040 [Deltaproteobacteria bacterium]|nr:hypothetical protein [Deltaproteobacteria bacterium]